MPKYENILAFIDVDNCAITDESYDNIMHQLSSMGEITTAKIYGVNQKKHRAIIDHAQDNGYEVAMPMRIKKRGAKVLDTRILVDVVTALHTVPSMDAVAVVCAPSDMVHLYRELKKYDIAVLALDNGDDATNALIDEPLDLGVVVELKLPKPKKPAVAKPLVEEVVAEPVVEEVVEPVVEEVVPEPVVEEVVAEPVEQVVSAPVVDEVAEPVVEEAEPQVEEPSPLTETEKLLAEIARLRQENEQISAQEEPQASNTPSTVVDDAENLLNLVNEYRAEQSEEVEPVAEPVVEAVAEEVIETAPAADPSLALDNKDDGDLLKRIQAIREQSHGDDAELVAKLKSLLLGE